MNKYVINKGFSASAREVEAESFATVGEFVDFSVWNAADAATEVVLRVKAVRVETIELVRE